MGNIDGFREHDERDDYSPNAIIERIENSKSRTYPDCKANPKDYTIDAILKRIEYRRSILEDKNA